MTNAQLVIFITCIILFCYVFFLFCCAINYKWSKHVLAGSTVFIGALAMTWMIYCLVSISDKDALFKEKAKKIHAYELKTPDMVVPNFFPPSELDMARQMAMERKVELVPLYSDSDK